MRLVDEDVIDAKFIEHEPVVLLVLGEQVLEAFGSGGFLLLDGLDEIAVGILLGRMFAAAAGRIRQSARVRNFSW